MKLFSKLAIAAVGVVLGFSSIPGKANAVSLDMITNGEFEEAQGTSDWFIAPNLNGWETTEKAGFELWNQGKIGSPAIGSDGLGTGKHLETNLHKNAIVTQSFTLGDNIDTNALFSFDAWSREAGTGTVSVLGSLSGNLLNTAISASGNSWTQNLFNLSVTAGETITIGFQGNQNDSVKSPHIDQVSFLVNEIPESVPEPASILGLLAVGAFGTASNLKRKNKQEA